MRIKSHSQLATLKPQVELSEIKRRVRKSDPVDGGSDKSSLETSTDSRRHQVAAHNHFAFLQPERRHSARWRASFFGIRPAETAVCATECVYGAATRSVSFYIYSSLRTPNSKFKSRYYADMSQLLALKKILHSLQSWLKLTSLACVIYWVSTGVRGQVAGRRNSSILNQLQLSVEKRKFEFGAGGNWKFFGSTFRLFCHCRKKVSAAATTHWFEKKRNNSRWHWSALTSPHWTRPLNADEVQRVAERQVSLLNWIFRKELRSTWRTLNEILWIMQNIWQAFSLRHALTWHLIEMLMRTWAWIDAVSLSIARITQSKSFDYDPVYFSATTFWKIHEIQVIF